MAPALSSDAVVYLSNLENHPKAVDVLARGRALWEMTPSCCDESETSLLLVHEFEERGFHVPRVLTSGQSTEQHRDVGRWLIKPRISGSGHGVRVWSANEPETRGHYLQEFIDGVPASVVFVAAGGRGVALGATRQLVGRRPLALGISATAETSSMPRSHRTRPPQRLRWWMQLPMPSPGGSWQHRFRGDRQRASARRSESTVVRIDGAYRASARHLSLAFMPRRVIEAHCRNSTPQRTAAESCDGRQGHRLALEMWSSET